MKNKTDQQLLELHAQIELMRVLATKTGFFAHYFKELGKMVGTLPKHRNQVECFNYVNEEYYDLFGEYRYNDYNSFRVSYNYYLTKKKP